MRRKMCKTKEGKEIDCRCVRTQKIQEDSSEKMLRNIEKSRRKKF